MTAPQGSGIADIMEIRWVVGQEISIGSGGCLKSFGAASGERQQVRSLCFLTVPGLERRDGGGFLEHNMGIRAAKAERVHSGQSRPISRRPCFQYSGNA